MKKLTRFLVITVFALGAFNNLQAQRGSRSSSGRDNGGTHVSQNRAERNSSADRSRNTAEQRSVRENSGNTYSRAINSNRDNGRADAVNNSRVISTSQQRNEVAVRDRNGNNQNAVTQQRAYRGSNNYGRERSLSQNVTQRNYNTYNVYNRRGYFPGHVFMAGPRYAILPRNSISVYFGGSPYYYNQGSFYGYYGGYYQPLFPPVGIRIGVLPFGYRRIFIGINPYYYFNGIYYRHYADRKDYEVVDAPMGATVASLPQGAKSVVLNNEKLYELNGTYYKEDRNYKGQTVYTVVGKNGEVNNSDNDTENNISVPPPSLNEGDKIDQLPAGSKAVTINGEKLFLTPNDTYLKEETEGNIVNYKVVGK